MLQLQRYPALVLNADFRPVCLHPLELKDAWEAIKNVWEDTVSVVEEYDEVVRSPTVAMRIPSVVALRTYVRAHASPSFTNENIFLRDRHRCQYCGEQKWPLTRDHVHPLSKGGRDAWDNVVAACEDCNSRKGDTVGYMHPMKVPREPTQAELHALHRARYGRRLHPTWLAYLPEDYVA